jgi:hypothetical protein
MSRIYISYRRNDTRYAASRIFDGLSQRFGDDQIFMDLDSIPYGADFRQIIAESIASYDIIVVLIGDHWLDLDQDGRRRIDSNDDWIRQELSIALRLKKVIVPVLIDHAQFPKRQSLPPDIQEFVRYDALRFATRSAQADLDRLGDILDSALTAPRARNERRPQLSPGSETPSTAEIHPSAVSASIILSYRRSDSAGISGRLFDRLRGRFGESEVYMDVDNIPFGTNFRKHVRDALGASKVVIAVIGPSWLGQRWFFKSRIFEDNDPVRIEIATALSLNRPVVPVLLDGTKMPSSSQLPPELAEFADINAAPLSSGRDFDAQAERLLKSVDSWIKR